MAKLLVLSFQTEAGQVLLSEELEGKDGMTKYAKDTVEAYKEVPEFAGYAIGSGKSEDEALANAEAKLASR